MRPRGEPAPCAAPCGVLYVDGDGAAFAALPLIVDGFGLCHFALDDAERGGCLCGQAALDALLASGEDMYLDYQLSVMRELEERRRMMDYVLEELLQRALDRRGADAAAEPEAPQLDAEADGLAATSSSKAPVDGSDEDVASAGSPYQATPALCAFSPREDLRQHNLHQPRAVY
eukprot:SM000072S21166  [mRNA]  locus=s72:120986:121872:+ [translate_table: standard]